MDFLLDSHFFVGETGADRPTCDLLTHNLNNFVANCPDALSVSLLANGYRVHMERPDSNTRVWHAEVINRPLPEPSYRDGFLLTKTERKLMAEGRKIAAIKSVRSRLSIGLIDAKDHCDLFEETHGINRENTQRPCHHPNIYVNNGVCKRCGTVGVEQ